MREDEVGTSSRTPLQEMFVCTPLPFKLFKRDSLTTPHRPTLNIFHCYPLSIHHSFQPLIKILI